MKKLMFTLAAFAVAFTSAQAQKQLGEEHNIEVSFNPLSGGLFGGNSIIDATSLKYRKFLDDDAALRDPRVEQHQQQLPRRSRKLASRIGRNRHVDSSRFVLEQ